MRAQWKILRHSVVFLSLYALTQPIAPAQATPGYTASPPDASAPELRAEMNDYDPAMLSIHFAQNPEIPANTTEEPPESGSLFAELQEQLPEASQAEAPPQDVAQAVGPAAAAPLATPEPGTFALLGLGLSMLAMRFRQKNTTN